MGLVGLLTNWDYGWIDLMDWLEVIFTILVGFFVISTVVFFYIAIDMWGNLLGVYFISILLVIFVSYIIGHIILKYSWSRWNID